MLWWILASGCTGEPTAEPEPPPEITEGRASWYGKKFAGRPTTSGEIFDPKKLTAAHLELPFGTRVKVTSERGTSVVVTINDRGPHADDRIIDLSRAAAQRIGLVEQGVGDVTIEVVDCPAGETCSLP